MKKINIMLLAYLVISTAFIQASNSQPAKQWSLKALFCCCYSSHAVVAPLKSYNPNKDACLSYRRRESDSGNDSSISMEAMSNHQLENKFNAHTENAKEQRKHREQDLSYTLGYE